jgi:hypothetical protein
MNSYEIEAVLADFKKKFDTSIADKIRLVNQIQATEVKLVPIVELTIALTDEQIRWDQQAAKLDENMSFIPDDSFYVHLFLFIYNHFHLIIV